MGALSFEKTKLIELNKKSVLFNITPEELYEKMELADERFNLRPGPS